jgi:hypothetical protein
MIALALVHIVAVRVCAPGRTQLTTRRVQVNAFDNKRRERLAVADVQAFYVLEKTAEMSSNSPETRLRKRIFYIALSECDGHKVAIDGAHLAARCDYNHALTHQLIRTSAGAVENVLDHAGRAVEKRSENAKIFKIFSKIRKKR